MYIYRDPIIIKLSNAANLRVSKTCIPRVHQTQTQTNPQTLKPSKPTPPPNFSPQPTIPPPIPHPISAPHLKHTPITCPPPNAALLIPSLASRASALGPPTPSHAPPTLRGQSARRSPRLGCGGDVRSFRLHNEDETYETRRRTTDDGFED